MAFLIGKNHDKCYNYRIRFFNIALKNAFEEDDKQMARIGLSRMLKHQTIENILTPKKKPTHTNNLKALEEAFNGN